MPDIVYVHTLLMQKKMQKNQQIKSNEPILSAESGRKIKCCWIQNHSQELL